MPGSVIFHWGLSLMMIDWMSVRIPVTLPCPIHGGAVVQLARDGTETLRTLKRLKVEGSFSSSINVRAPSVSELEISGNPLKWMQGHNLYAPHADPRLLLWDALQRMETLPDLFPCSLREMGLYSADSLADAIVTRIDCTAMLLFASGPDVSAWIRAAHQTGHVPHRGRGVLEEGTTLVFGHAGGKSFTRWQIKLYSKGREIVAHPLPELMMQDAEVLEWTNKCLRVEVVLGRHELKEQGLRALGMWTGETAGVLWGNKVARMQFNETNPTYDVEALPMPLRRTFVAWTTGEDLRRIMTLATYKRHRSEIEKLTGINIGVPPASAGTPTAKVLPIRSVIEAVPATRPAWADRIDRALRAAA